LFFWEVPHRSEVAHNKGFTYYVDMNVTLSLDEKLVKEVRKIAVEQDTTLTGLVRAYLEQVAAEHGSERKRRDLELLNQTFDRFQAGLHYGKRNWRRADLYHRKSQ